jgi:putative PIN family toxin of toxin-antitoxin system
MKVERVVVDTNVLISFALKPDGIAGQVVDWILENGQLVFCIETFKELGTRLWRPKFDRYLTLEERKLLLHDFEMSATWVTIANELRFSRDLDDDKFIETALVTSAPILISGDNDLLDLSIEALEIITPRQFYEQFLTV